VSFPCRQDASRDEIQGKPFQYPHHFARKIIPVGKVVGVFVLVVIFQYIWHNYLGQLANESVLENRKRH